VTPFAVASILNPFPVDQHVHVLDVPWRAEGVRMRRLAPLRICRLMAVAAVFCREKAVRIDELSRIRRGVGRKKRLVRPKAEVVMRSDTLRVLRTLRSWIVDRIGRPSPPCHDGIGNRGRQQNTADKAQNSIREVLGKHRANNSIGFRGDPASALDRERSALHQTIDAAILLSDEDKRPSVINDDLYAIRVLPLMDDCNPKESQ